MSWQKGLYLCHCKRDQYVLSKVSSLPWWNSPMSSLSKGSYLCHDKIVQCLTCQKVLISVMLNRTNACLVKKVLSRSWKSGSMFVRKQMYVTINTLIKVNISHPKSWQLIYVNRQLYLCITLSHHNLFVQYLITSITVMGTNAKFNSPFCQGQQNVWNLPGRPVHWQLLLETLLPDFWKIIPSMELLPNLLRYILSK